MSLTAHVYQIYIAASPEQVWAAITESEWTRRYFHATSFVEPPQCGKAYRTVRADGRPAIDGVIEEMQPPGARTPGRFVQTWHILYDSALEQEPPGRVELTARAVGGALPRLVPAVIQRPAEQLALPLPEVRPGGPVDVPHR